jgi:hypothetical protein
MINFNISSLPLEIFIGYTGENIFRSFAFDVTEWKNKYPEGVVSISFRRPDQTTGYPVVVNSSENPVIWTVTKAEVSVPGKGEIVLRLSENEVIGKTYSIPTITKASPDFTGDPPDPFPDWLSDILEVETRIADDVQEVSANTQTVADNLETVLEKAAEALQSAANALASEENAKTSEDNAKDYADEAERQADIARNNILNGVAAHNESEESHPYVLSEMVRIESIARGKASAKVFDTTEEMNDWLSDPDNVETLKIGDNLYIRDINVPDYWWDGEQPKILEAQAINLSDYYTKAEVNGLVGDIESALDAILGV